MWRNGETVEILRDSPRDRYGDGGGFDFHHLEHNVIIKWGPSEGLEGQRDGDVTEVTLFFPNGADVLASDRVRLPDGDEHWVNGKPERPQGAFSGRRPYVKVRLKAVT